MVACVDQAGLLELELTSREHCEIWNAADVVLGCKPRVAFGIHFSVDATERSPFSAVVVGASDPPETFQRVPPLSGTR